MALNESWHIRSRARACSATERPFDDGEKIMTALFPDPESSGYVRKDFSMDAWKARTAEDEKAFCFWKTVYHAPVAGAEKQDAFKRESPEELLRRLVEEEEEHTENARYILAVMLERQKVLRETDTQRTPSGILRVYEHRKLGDVFIVRDPDIPLAEVEKVQEEVILLLEPGRNVEEEAPVEEAVSVSTEEPVEGDDPAAGEAEESAAISEDEAAESGLSAEEAMLSEEGEEDAVSEEDFVAEEGDAEAGDKA
jgi:hypothetical protein